YLRPDSSPNRQAGQNRALSPNAVGGYSTSSRPVTAPQFQWFAFSRSLSVERRTILLANPIDRDPTQPKADGQIELMGGPLGKRPWIPRSSKSWGEPQNMM